MPETDPTQPEATGYQPANDESRRTADDRDDAQAGQPAEAASRHSDATPHPDGEGSPEPGGDPDRQGNPDGERHPRDTERHPQGDGERHPHGDGRRVGRPARHRLRRRLDGRTRYLVTGLVALLGLGVAAGSAVVLGDGSDQRTERAAVAADESARAAAGQRADRSTRKDTVATPPPAPSPTAVAPTTSARPPAANATRAGKSSPASKAPTTRRTPAWVNPLPGAETTSCFGMRWGTLHAGIDLAMPADTPIHAAGAGTVVTAGWAYTGYGISVVVDHGNGYLTHYAHQSRTVVSVGDRVAAGDVIGYEGSTGDVTGPHLHFEVHEGLWNQVDPAPWMREHGVDLGC